jgi:hypothetical protein
MESAALTCGRLFDADACDSKSLARACHKMLPVLARCDAETQEALCRLYDEQSDFKREDGLALATALLLELRSRAKRR